MFQTNEQTLATPFSLSLLLRPHVAGILHKTYLQRRLSQPGQRTAATGSSAGSSLCQLLQLELFGQMFKESWRAASKGEGIPRASYCRAQVTQAAHCTRCNQLPLMNPTCSSSGNVCIPIRAFPFTLTLQLARAPAPSSTTR